MKTGNIGKKEEPAEQQSIHPDRDEEPAKSSLVAPETATANDSTDEVTGDEVQLQELMSAWDRASVDVRQQFLANIGVSLSPQAEAGPAPSNPAPPQEPAFSETEEPSPIEPQANPLFEIWKGLRGHTSWYGRRWLEIGCPDGALPDEHWTFTEKLVPFRDAARKATEDQRQRFLELSRAA
jgi:hypothetical protein